MIRTWNMQIIHGSGADNEIWIHGEENCIMLKKYIDFRELMRDYKNVLMNEVQNRDCR